MPHLTVLNGSNKGRMVPLTLGQPLRVGRDPTLELSLDDAKASRTHIEIEIKGEKTILRDLRSKNGTLLNGAPVNTVVLKDGDEIQIGQTRMVFVAQDIARPDLSRPLDSATAPRRPIGVMPTLGSGGTGAKDDTESFETLDLDAPLTLLKAEGEAGEGDSPPSDDSQRTPESLERANGALCALYSIARACAESKTPSGLLGVLSERLQEVLEADRVTPILLDDDGQWRPAELEPPNRGGDGDSPRVSAAFGRVPVSRTIVDYALKTSRSVLTTPRSDARFEEARSIGEQGITSALCVPIVVQERMLGLIYADRLGGEDFDRADQELLTAACLQAGPALTRLQDLDNEIRRKERLLKELKSQHQLLGESAPIQAVLDFITRAAPTESVVLVLGESGTGKELVARAIHYQSARKDGPLVIVNCAALSESLIESELFGHAKGAFTGASADRKGRFEMAHEGTIFLDEIGELSGACQTKLLRVLEQGEISRVGEARVRKVDVRLVAATNRDLAAEVKAGHFREDLFYRLNVLAVQLPPLRDRGSDIGLLCEHFLRESAARCARPRLRFSQEALEVLQQYRWPGNVRELRNMTERLAVLCPQEIIGVRDLPPETVGGTGAVDSSAAEDGASEASQDVAGPEPVSPDLSGKPLAEIEKEHVLRVLEGCGGNKKQAAEVLGIDRSTLYAKLRAYGQ